MPRERQSITHKFSLGGHEGYITAGMYEDGTVGEIFLTDIGKEGSTLRGMMNSFATAISIALQYGVPLETLVRKFAYMRFEPEGITTNPEIPFAKSMPDYIMRWLASRFLDADIAGGARHPHARRSARGRRPRTPRRRSARDTAGAATGPAAPAQRPQRRPAAPEAAAAADRPPPPTAALTDTPPVVPGAHGRPRPRPGVQPVRRHDAAHGLLLHVLELRQQHRLRLSRSPSSGRPGGPSGLVAGRPARAASGRARARGRPGRRAPPDDARAPGMLSAAGASPADVPVQVPVRLRPARPDDRGGPQHDRSADGEEQDQRRAQSSVGRRRGC